MSKLEIVPAYRDEIPAVNSLDELIGSEKLARLPVPATATLSKYIINNHEEDYYVVPNAKIILDKGCCLIITEDHRYLPSSFCKSWPYYKFQVSKDSAVLNIGAEYPENNRLNGTWFCPFTMANVSHLYHAIFDNYGRLAWLNGALAATNVLIPTAAWENNHWKEVDRAFTEGINFRPIYPGMFEVGRLIVPPPGNRNDALFNNVVEFASHKFADPFQSRDQAPQIAVVRISCPIAPFANWLMNN